MARKFWKVERWNEKGSGITAGGSTVREIISTGEFLMFLSGALKL